MANTTYFQWTYPDDNTEPYFDVIESFYSQQDNDVFGIINTACNIIIPPSTVIWNSSTLTLTWNADFQIPIFSSGFFLNIKYGPDHSTRSATFLNGSRLMVTVPTTSNANVNANFEVVNGAVASVGGLMTIGFCSGTHFYANFPQVF